MDISWINERTFDVQELSGFSCPIVYRITTADGYYATKPGERVYFTPEVAGLSTQRKADLVILRQIETHVAVDDSVSGMAVEVEVHTHPAAVQAIVGMNRDLDSLSGVCSPLADRVEGVDEHSIDH